MALACPKPKKEKCEVEASAIVRVTQHTKPVVQCKEECPKKLRTPFSIVFTPSRKPKLLHVGDRHHGCNLECLFVLEQEIRCHPGPSQCQEDEAHQDVEVKVRAKNSARCEVIHIGQPKSRSRSREESSHGHGGKGHKGAALHTERHAKKLVV